MSKTKQLKTLLKQLIKIAEESTAPYPIGFKKITDEDSQQIRNLIAGIQNDLGEMEELLAKFGLEWKG